MENKKTVQKTVHGQGDSPEKENAPNLHTRVRAYH
jgi:hypothetical protein